MCLRGISNFVEEFLSPFSFFFSRLLSIIASPHHRFIPPFEAVFIAGAHASKRNIPMTRRGRSTILNGMLQYFYDSTTRRATTFQLSTWKTIFVKSEITNLLVISTSRSDSSLTVNHGMILSLFDSLKDFTVVCLEGCELFIFIFLEVKSKSWNEKCDCNWSNVSLTTISIGNIYFWFKSR